MLLAAPLMFFVPGTAAQDPVTAPQADPVTEYLEAIAGAESAGGAYAIELVDLYHGMGQSLLERGELTEARDAFYRAAMVARVNSGPFSLEQTNYLYSIADVESRLGRPEEAIQALDNIYRINAKEYGEEGPEMLPVAKRIYDWYATHLTSGVAPALPSDFQNLSFLMERIAQMTEAQNGLGNATTAMTYRTLGQTHFQAIRFLVQTGQFPEPDRIMHSVEGGSQSAPERVVVNHLLAGEEALKRVAQAWQENPDGTDLEVAEALAQIGDWNLALGFDRAAELNYEQAYQVLAGSPEFGFMADRYMGKPTPLRLMNTAENFVRDLDPPDDGSTLEVTMTVTSKGVLQDVDIVEAPAGATEENLQDLRKRLETTLFRPAVVNGEVQTVQGFVWVTPARITLVEPEDSQG